MDAQEWRKLMRKWMEDNCVNGVCKKDGTIEVRVHFFYHNGKDSQSTATRISSQLNSAGIPHRVVNHQETWRPWPKDSYWSVWVAAPLP